MLKTITSLLGRQRTLNAELELDHIELSRNQLILGLKLTWANDTADAIEIGGVMVKLFQKGKREAPISLFYHGRFVRIPFQKGVTKIAGVTSFPIKPGATLVENIRFLTRDIHELADGSYAVELHTTVADGTYLHNFVVKVVPDLKYRVEGSENDASSFASSCSSAYTRALRIGLNSSAAK